MSGSLLPAVSSHSLTESASHLLHRIPELFHRLRILEAEEAQLDAQTRQLTEQLQTARDRTSAPPIRIISTPVSKRRGRVTECTVDGDSHSTPSCIDPKNIETPVKAFLLMESFALAMSIKSKRKGRIFLPGDSTEFGERRQR